MTSTFAKGTNDAAEANCPMRTISFEACLGFYVGWGVGGLKGTKEMGQGKGLLVRPPGRGMLSTLHPGKGSLRSSGPICSRRGK